MDQEPGQGVSFYIPWSLVEYAVTGVFAMVSAGALWVWRLAWRIGKLEEDMLSAGNDLKEIAEENREHIKEIHDKIKEMNNDLPSRNFIEGQIGRLEARLDRAMDRMQRPD